MEFVLCFDRLEFESKVIYKTLFILLDNQIYSGPWVHNVEGAGPELTYTTITEDLEVLICLDRDSRARFVGSRVTSKMGVMFELYRFDLSRGEEFDKEENQRVESLNMVVVRRVRVLSSFVQPRLTI